MALGGGGLELGGLPLLKAGDHLIFPQVNEPATPTLSFGGNSGFYEAFDGDIRLALEGVEVARFVNGTFRGTANSCPLLNLTIPSSETIPGHTFVNDQNLGVGRRTTDIGVLIAGGLNVMEFGEAGAAPLCGFYGTAAIAKQIGVAVSAAGIHAALVALGLIGS